MGISATGVISTGLPVKYFVFAVISEDSWNASQKVLGPQNAGQSAGGAVSNGADTVNQIGIGALLRIGDDRASLATKYQGVFGGEVLFDVFKRTKSVEKAEVVIDSNTDTTVTLSSSKVSLIGTGSGVTLSTATASLEVIMGFDTFSGSTVTFVGSKKDDLVNVSDTRFAFEGSTIAFNMGEGSDSHILGAGTQVVVLETDGDVDRIENFDPSDDLIAIEGLTERTKDELEISTNKRGLIKLDFRGEIAIIDNLGMGPQLTEEDINDALALLTSPFF